MQGVGAAPRDSAIKWPSLLSDTLIMFLGFGMVSGRASVIGHANDRVCFQLVSEAEVSYRPRQFRASIEAFGRAQRDRKAVNWSDKAKQN